MGGLAPRGCPKVPSCPTRIPSLPGCVAAGVTDRTQILKNIRDGIKGMFPLYNLGFGHDVDLNFLEIMSLENNGSVQRIYEDHDATQQLQVSSPTAHQSHAMGIRALAAMYPPAQSR